MAQVAMSPQLEAQAQSCVSLLASLEAELALTAAHVLSSPATLPASTFASAPASAMQGPMDPLSSNAVKGSIGPFAPCAGVSQTPESVLSPPISASASDESSEDGPDAAESNASLHTEIKSAGATALTTAVDGAREGSNSPERGPEAVPRCACAGHKTEAEYGFQASAVPCGAPGTPGFRLYFRTQAGALASPWHTIPLFADGGMLHMVCEIPRNTRAKFEVSTSEFSNPIKQDTKKGKLRFYGIDMKWNYGMFPQTWEDPSHASEDCGGFVGDNDPVDVVEVGDHDPSTGAVYAVKPIAALAMIDEGELDWKVVAVSAGDPRCALVNDVEDLEVHFPGQLAAIREWFRTYKTHEGKGLNKFELNEEFVGQRYTMDVIAQTHGFWKSLVRRSRGDWEAGEEKGKEGCVGVAVGNVPLISGCFADEVHSAGTSVFGSDTGSITDGPSSREDMMSGYGGVSWAAMGYAMLGA